MCNSASGRGRGPRVVADALTALSREDHSTTRLDVNRADPAGFLQQLHDATREHDVTVIAGGDGTVHFSLPALLHAS